MITKDRHQVFAQWSKRTSPTKENQGSGAERDRFLSMMASVPGSSEPMEKICNADQDPGRVSKDSIPNDPLANGGA